MSSYIKASFMVMAVSLAVAAVAAPVAMAQSSSSSSASTQMSGSASSGGGQMTGTSPGPFVYLQNPVQFNSVGGIINGFLTILSYVAVLFGVLMIIWVGLQFVLAQGKPEKMNELKSWLMWIVIGIAIVIGARIIVSIVINTLEATNVVSPTVIQGAKAGLDASNPRI